MEHTQSTLLISGGKLLKIKIICKKKKRKYSLGYLISNLTNE
jgi:hypothetical protein